MRFDLTQYNKFLYPLAALALAVVAERLAVDIGVDYDYIKGAAVTALVALFAPANGVKIRSDGQ